MLCMPLYSSGKAPISQFTPLLKEWRVVDIVSEQHQDGNQREERSDNQAAGDDYVDFPVYEHATMHTSSPK